MASQRQSQRILTQTGTQRNATQRSQNHNPDLTRKINQYMLHHGCVTEEELLVAIMKLVGDDEILDSEGLSLLINNLNKKLRPYNFMIRLCLDEISLKKYYILISIVDNAVTRNTSLYSPKQLEFFKLILQAVVNEATGVIIEKELKEIAQKATLKPSEYTGLFREWTNKNWFVVVTEGEPKVDYVTLGVRAIAELDVFIKQKLVSDEKDLICKACKNMAIYSAFCADCKDRYHKRCSKMYLNDETNLCKKCHEKVN